MECQVKVGNFIMRLAVVLVLVAVAVVVGVVENEQENATVKKICIKLMQ